MRPAWLSRWPGLRGSQSICIRTNRAFGSVAIRCCCDGRRSERRFLPCARSRSRASFCRIPCLVWLWKPDETSTQLPISGVPVHLPRSLSRRISCRREPRFVYWLRIAKSSCTTVKGFLSPWRRFFGLGLHVDSSIRENVRREPGLCLAGFQKRIWLSEKQLLNLRCHRITMV